MNTQQARTLLGQVVADATALLAEAPDEIDAAELAKYISDAEAFHSEDFVDLIGFNEAVNSIIYDTAFRGVVIKPANYEKSKAHFHTLHDAYPYLEIDVNGYKVHILARRVAIKTREATPPYNVRSYLVLEVSVTKPGERQAQEQTEEQGEEQGEEEEQGGAEEKS
jgi:hypothetical protein